MSTELWAPVLGAGAGLLIGSYVATLTLRWPQGRSASSGRSHCDACGRTLAWFELVPLLSFAALRGRCRACRTPVDRRHPLIEVTAALMGALALAVAPGIEGVFGAVFGWMLLALAVLDVEHLWLPDLLTVPLLASGLLAGLFIDPPLLDRAIGAAVGFAALSGIAVLYEAARGRRGMGGGDPKLFAGLGAWLGWVALPFLLLLAAILGLGLAILRRVRGQEVTGMTPLPLGALLATAAWALWLVASHLLLERLQLLL